MLSLFGRFISLTLVAAVVVAGLVLAGSGFLVMLPALVLLAPLLLGRYVGEANISRIRRVLATRRLRPLARWLPTAERRGHALLFRGGRLIAASIAVRPPPVVA